MGRRRKGNKVNGWVVVDKPGGLTSTQVVSRVRRVFNAAKAGHAGTLDPIATGILPIALGEATKTVPYLMDARKAYRFTLCFGEERNTDDIEGTVTETSDVRPGVDEINAALGQFIGEIEQVPPKFSAIKIDGKRAYDLARSDEEVIMKSRRIMIHGFEFERFVDADHADFHVRSGKGAYMRSLARDLARAVGSMGHIAKLRRLQVGPFSEENAIALEDLQALEGDEAAFDHLLPVEEALDGIPAMDMTGDEAAKLRCGQGVPIFRASDRDRVGDLSEGDMLYTMSDGIPIAISRISGGMVCPVRVLNL